ncbi:MULTISPECIES: OmpA family protein [unclassified Pseudoalteromonas]|uniref:OmpA family protein n=1 Tax=unclassified Pseudoalteromonas TaxID=194690 RepID=UPI0020985705|nr:OmpA family protein [Pseudoalteromonas sp. XMcav2-N]MCO7188896.1 OmpA family protein [Pseudoalteromonas sp. XMcav2-N]
MRMNKILLGGGVIIALSGCEMSNTGKGATIGAAAGAVLGKATGNHKDKRVVIGAAVGAIAGAAIGNYMDEQEAAFNDALEGSGVQVVRDGEQIRLVLPSNITFATGLSVINPGFQKTLAGIARVMHKYDKTLLSIIGHTDSTGAAGFNQILSEQRANSVKQSLLPLQIHPDRIHTQGAGESQPIASNDTEQGRAQNRRVEINIIPNRAS